MKDMYGNKKSTSRNIFFAVLALVVVGIGTALFVVSTTQPVTVDSVTFCPVKESDYSYVTGGATFIIDTTDPLKPSQKIEIKNLMSQAIKKLEVFDIVRVYEIRSDVPEGARKYTPSLYNKSVSEFCIPQRSNWESPRRKELLSALRRTVEDAFSEITQRNSPQPFSPILDGLRFAAADSGTNPGRQYLQRHHVYIVSDMLEHTPKTLNVYKPEWYTDSYMNDQNYFIKLRPRFQPNINVTVWMLARPTRGRDLQGKNLIDFWYDMISGTHRGIQLELKHISGGN